MTSTESAKLEVLEGLEFPNEAPFSKPEYRERLERIRQQMSREGIECLYLSSPESINYVSGYAAEWYQANSPLEWAPGAGIAVHVDHDHFIHFEHIQEQTLIAITSVSEDVRITELESVSQLEFIVDELRDSGWLNGRIGLEMGAYRPYRTASELFQGLLEEAGAGVVDGTGICRTVRRRKSAAEIAFVRKAQEIADIGLAKAKSVITPGVTELEIYGEIVSAMSKAGGEVTAIPMPVVSGPRAQTLHGLASRREIQPGELVCVDVCGVYNRYHANTARSFFVGDCDPRVADAASKVYGAVDVVAETIRPGLPVQELLDTLEAYYRDAGILADEWWVGGYELGVSFPPDWVGGFIYSLGEDHGDERFLPGDVVNFEANFYLPEKTGIAFCINSMAFEESSAAFLQKTPNRLEILK